MSFFTSLIFDELLIRKKEEDVIRKRDMIDTRIVGKYILFTIFINKYKCFIKRK